MNEYDAFYEENVYPLQNGVLKTLADCDAPFYLTGGTALHRHYFSYRYSDDLDLFIQGDPDYGEHVDEALDAIRDARFRIDQDMFIRGDHYTRIVVIEDDIPLRIDLVNDTAPYFGTYESGELFPRIDNLRNILSNKLTALYRLEIKDTVDLWAICKRLPFDWGELLDEATQKEMGIDAATIADIIKSVPEHLFDELRWKNRPERVTFFHDVRRLADDLLHVRMNSLGP